MKAIYFIILLLFSLGAHAQIKQPWTKALERLTPQEKHIIVNKGTERPFSGKYVHTDSKGVYRCKVCNAALYKSDDKFRSDCGWPSFDDAIPGAIKRQKDSDGRRTEIVCARCGAHLGHLFVGEGLTPKNRRYCVNSISLTFDKAETTATTHYRRAYFAGGCFWGVEYYLEKLDGVKEVSSGFMGGSVEHPSYEQVVTAQTGHLETVEVLYDPNRISYETLAKTFFEIHDPTQKDGQGPDIGEQYHSAIFVADDKERKTAEKLIAILRGKGYDVATKILTKKPFYKAEAYHQDYYDRHGKKPYCHGYIKRF
ncbi:MAG TPA: bifunctional methionine sulfoxide reductase B/A protein [Epsilonproteobacteria bacterium]|nr:bifunctional methionine sulfoxide reductase B/A protein [Campylobacterota bacterium]